MRAMAARLARRPWRRREQKEAEAKTLVTIKAMKDSELRKLVRMVMMSFDGTSRSIARSNIKLALKSRTDVVWMTSKVRSPMLGVRQVKQKVEQEVKRWSTRMRNEEQKTIILEHQAVATATRSTLQLLNNTEPMSKRKRGELK